MVDTDVEQQLVNVIVGWVFLLFFYETLKVSASVITEPRMWRAAPAGASLNIPSLGAEL